MNIYLAGLSVVDIIFLGSSMSMLTTSDACRLLVSDWAIAILEIKCRLATTARVFDISNACYFFLVFSRSLLLLESLTFYMWKKGNVTNSCTAPQIYMCFFPKLANRWYLFNFRASRIISGVDITGTQEGIPQELCLLRERWTSMSVWQ